MRASHRLGQRLLTTPIIYRPIHLIPRRSLLSPAQPPFSSQFVAPHSPIVYSPLRPPARCSSTQAASASETALTNPSQPATQEPSNPPPSYQLTFTCKPCTHRSSHRITKQGYHRGTVLITCPSCKNRHVISDHLKIFLDEKSTLEDILRRKVGPESDLRKLLKRGRLGIREGELVGREGEEDIEFWEDGTESAHERKTGE